MSSPLLFAQNADGLFFKPAVSSIEKEIDPVIHIPSHEQIIKTVSTEEFPIHGKITKVAALLGFIRLKLNKYAIIADTVEETGRLNGHIIYKVVQHSIVPTKLNSRVNSDEAEYIKLLELQMKNATLYFSYTYDLTNSYQRNEQIQSASWKTTDNRFFWNYFITEELRALNKSLPEVSRFIQPVIYGYAKVVDTVFNSTPISIGLITRRSRFRAGTRYFRRGVDSEGNVGNFNETEQVLIVQNTSNNTSDLYAFLQTRGSVPVYWAEINNLKYKPNLVLGDNSSLDSTKKHFDAQKTLYGDNYLVNLVNQSGYEAPVKQAYETAVDTLNDSHLHYIYFDFHHECRKMQWHRVKLLIDKLKDLGLSNTDVFHKLVGTDGKTVKVISEQSSVVRTNCMDCLDRTNVVQSVLAHWILQKEFETAGVTTENNPWESDKSLLSYFQNLWADNADAVSFSYSGTGALKTDFTRTGKRTRMGALSDLSNSISRYYQNNLTDGPRQDSYDLFLGNFEPTATSVRSPFPDRRPVYIQAIPTILYAALTVLGATIFFPKNHFFSSKNLLFFISALLVLAATGNFMIKNGMQFVNWPKLVDVGFLVVHQTHNKERQFKGLKYVASSNFYKPGSLKND